ncbi:MAG: Fic family protein [Candidatus Limnocylindrales bacterium]
MPRLSGSGRAGRYVRQPSGYAAFIPARLPPEPAIDLARLAPTLSAADQAIGRLDGVSRTLPNPDLFVAMYVRREAVLSSQIEGTQSSLDDVLAYELDASATRLPLDVEEVFNHVAAMNYGLERLASLPLSLRLIREIHERLMAGVRGAEKTPGEFRRSQNWIGPPGASLQNASFVPPPPHKMLESLGDLERFFHEPGPMPALVLAGVAHAQFETIHPFLDGNGRVGRLFITFLLVHRGVIGRPLLYLSHYLKRHRSEYYDRLTSIRESGDWEGWLTFFLLGVAATADEATHTAAAILEMRQMHREVAAGLGVNALRLLDHLYDRPLVNVGSVAATLGVSWPTAGKLIGQLEERGLLQETTGHRRNRIFRYGPYLALFEDDDSPKATAV